MKIIGLMSGTSVDGIDAALVEINGTTTDLKVEVLAAETFPYPEKLRQQILSVCGGKPLTMEEFATLDDAIAMQFAHAAKAIGKGELIGSHGQTVFHRPATSILGYSLQLGRGGLIAHLTKTVTISNFRVADIAMGGQGAPLVPLVDAYMLSDPEKSRVIQNLGGIGNLTYIPAQSKVNCKEGISGWDTGPGNALLDLAVQWLTEGKRTFDQDGRWASEGTPCQGLVQRWLKQDFFWQPPPKSTGRELFGEAYLHQCWQDSLRENLTPADFLATLTELTVDSCILSYRSFLPQMPDQVLLCGGGSRNIYLKQRLEAKLKGVSQVLTTDEVGINGDFKEAIAFAVLAYWRWQKIKSPILPMVTGAKEPVLLGEVHSPVL